jgi:hypothetical protein
MNNLRMFSIIGIIGCALFSQDLGAKEKPKGYFPCMTLGATYTEVWEELAGTCGKVPDTTLNIDKNGTTSLNECEKKSLNKCTTIGVNCRSNPGNGLSLIRAFKTELSVDGKTGTSFEIVEWSYNGKFMCSSIYSTTLKRLPRK